MLRSQPQQQPQQQQVNINFVHIPGLLSFVLVPFAVDISMYDETRENPERSIEITLFGAGACQTYQFEGEQADIAWHWYLQATGQSRVEPVAVTPILG